MTTDPSLIPPISIKTVCQDISIGQIGLRLKTVMPIGAADAVRAQGFAEAGSRNSTADHWSALFSGLTSNQSIEFCYRSDPTMLGSFGFTVDLMVSCQGPDQAVLRNEVSGLLRSLEFVLALTVPGCGFQVFDPSTYVYREDYSSSSEICPRGIFLRPHATVGFSPSYSDNAVEALLAPPATQGILDFSALVDAMRALPMKVGIRVLVNSLHIAKPQRDALIQFLKPLPQWPSSLVYEDDLTPCDIAPEQLTELVAIQEAWLLAGRGFQFQCQVDANDPLPSVFLEMVGSVIYQGRLSRTQPSNKKFARPYFASKTHAIDFRRAFSADRRARILLPPVATLQSFGFPPKFPNIEFPLSETGMVLGKLASNGGTRDLQLPDRTRHCYLIGATGTGKSTLLLRMMLEDACRGEGFAVVDPHGDLSAELLGALPRHRQHDVVVFRPDPDFAMGLNFLECSTKHVARQRGFLINELLSIFDRLWDMRRAGGPVFEQYVRNALLLLMNPAVRQATLDELPAVFSNSAFRNSLLAVSDNPLVVEFWRGAERRTGEAGLANMTAYIVSKFDVFLSNAVLHTIVAQPRSAVDFRQIMDQGKILVVDLSKEYLGEKDTQLLGMLLTSRLFNAALSRAELPPESRRPFYLYLDEFQCFISDSLAKMLAEARKYGLHLTLAHQTLSQLKNIQANEDLRDAVLGNVGSRILFRVGMSDAKQLADSVTPHYSAEFLTALPDFHAICRCVSGKLPMPPVVLKTQPISPSRSNAEAAAMREDIRRANLSHHYRPVEEVEALIRARRDAWANKALQVNMIPTQNSLAWPNISPVGNTDSGLTRNNS